MKMVKITANKQRKQILTKIKATKPPIKLPKEAVVNKVKMLSLQDQRKPTSANNNDQKKKKSIQKNGLKQNLGKPTNATNTSDIRQNAHKSGIDKTEQNCEHVTKNMRNKAAGFKIKEFIIRLPRIVELHKKAQPIQKLPGELKENNNNTYVKSMQVIEQSDVGQDNNAIPTTTKVHTYRKFKNNSRNTVLKKRDRPSQVFNFTQDSIEDMDPAGDIVKKLIEENKVRVATCAKGTGRPKIKRLPAKMFKLSKQKAIGNKLTKVKAPKLNTPPREKSQLRDDKSDIYNAFDDDHELHNISPIPSPVLADGTYSDLARTVLLHQTNKTYSPQKKSTNEQHILNAVRKIVSTPINNKKLTSPTLSTVSNFSAISLPGNIEPFKNSNGSPWRLDEHLPRVFYFNYNSSNLPSFSCDIFLSEIKDGEQTITNQKQPTNQPENAKHSASFNDSNAENIPPPITLKDNRPQNDRLMSLKQQANPHSRQVHRTPLKTINILDVIHLPPWKPIEKQHENAAIETQQLSNDNEKVSQTKQDLFGFEEFLNDDDSVYVNNTLENAINTSISNETLHQKLHELRKWRPKKKQKNDQLSIISKSTSDPQPNLFNDPNKQEKKQRHINEMLCSTMIHPKCDVSARQFAKTKGETSNLFEDIHNVEETTFNEDVSINYFIYFYERLCIFWNYEILNSYC